MITVFCSVNSTAPGLHWWLCNDDRFGPQAYFLPSYQPQGKHIGAIVLEDRDGVHVDKDIYERHQKTHQNMELLDAEDGVIHFTQPFENCFTYDNVVWSNYFGTFKCPDWKIKSDHSIIIDSTMEDFIFNYVSVYAFSPLSVDEIERDSRIWYEDHTVLDNQVMNDWKKIWYENYHDQCLQEFENGNLQYMWQLNFAHWDLAIGLMEGNTDFKLDFSESRLFEKFDNYEEIEFNKNVIKNNPDSLVVPTDWHNNPQQILDFIGVSDSEQLQESLKIYSHKYNTNREMFNKLFGQYL